MRTRLLLFLLPLAIATIIVSCKSNTNQEPESNKVKISTVQYEVLIDGMTCTGCEQTIQTAVNGLDGIEKVTVSHEKGSAILEIQEGMFDSLTINSRISESGYTVTGFKNLNE